MKNKITLALCALLMTVIISSCSTSSDVASNRKIQKRKYNKGLFVSKNKKFFGKTNEESKDVLNIQNEVAEVAEISASVKNENFVSNVQEETNDVVQQAEVKENKGSSIESASSLQAKSSSAKIQKKSDIKNVVEKVRSIKKNAKHKKENLKGSLTADDMLILLVILCFLIPFVAVGIKTDWDITKVLISILLSILFWIPGIIYALLVVLDVI